jgi:hypothetical protein
MREQLFYIIMKEEKDSKSTNEEKIISIQKRIALKMILQAAPQN